MAATAPGDQGGLVSRCSRPVSGDDAVIGDSGKEQETGFSCRWSWSGDSDSKSVNEAAREDGAVTVTDPGLPTVAMTGGQ